MEGISETIKFLTEYPIKETPYPPGFPEDLIFDHYPGKDFVIGVCDETIEGALSDYADTKKQAIKDALKEWIKLLKVVRENRVKKLAEATPPAPRPKFKTIKDQRKKDEQFEKAIIKTLF